MSMYDQLDEIWNKAVKESPCICKTDDMWSQDSNGSIVCDLCKCQVVEANENTVTEKQMHVINIIKQNLGVVFVGENSKEASDFIKAHMAKSKSEARKLKDFYFSERLVELEQEECQEDEFFHQ